MRRGWFTSEFWASVLSVATVMVDNFAGDGSVFHVVATAVIAAGYSISRGLAKTKANPS